MTPIVDGLRYERKAVPTVDFLCPVCGTDQVQSIRREDTEGSLVGMMPHGSCKDADVLIRVR